MKHIYLCFLIVFMLLTGCQTYTIQYEETSVPEEGGINFRLYSSPDELLYVPGINTDESGRLRWWAAPMIATSNDGEHIAYLNYSNQKSNIILRRIAGGQSTVQRTFNRMVSDISFSPDNAWIAFTERRDDTRSINMVNASEGAAIRQITNRADGTTLGPTFSKDGSSIFYVATQGSRHFIWNVNLSTSIKTQYAEGYTPVVSPDGEHLIITRNSRDGIGRGEIWTINLLTGSESLILSDSEMGYSSPDISPDGQTIVCVGTTPATDNRPQNLDIYTIKTDGTQLQQLTFHGGHDLSPIWSSDGSEIFFLSQRGNESGKFGVWSMNYQN